jgi:hypothetical protein
MPTILSGPHEIRSGGTTSYDPWFGKLCYRSLQPPFKETIRDRSPSGGLGG